ncbi:MAG: type 1 glutamine amidotransferase domain-containing protein [bacterium]|nr:type 1 glutamine amidotransferase domain-containing protein [bacterium]
MMKKYPILKWSLISLTALIFLVVGFGYWFISLLPESISRDYSKTQSSEIPYLAKTVTESRGKILMVVTSTGTMGSTGKATGYELTELSRAYHVFQANGFEIDIASPLGGNPPVVIDDEDMGPYDYAFLNDPEAQSKVKNSIAMKDVIASEYRAVYFAGGKGAMYDFPEDSHIQSLVSNYLEEDKVVGAVCHGPAALVNVKSQEGNSILQGRQVCSFTNSEELFLIPDAEVVFPFLLQTKLEEKGAVFNDGTMYLNNVVQDGNLITGQNPWSTWEMAETMVKQLGYTPKHRDKSGNENAGNVLAIYESEGIDRSKEQIKNLAITSQEFNRTLIAMHSIVEAMQWELGRSIDMIRLVSYSKSQFEG